jgi:hypothetical protein
MTKAKRSPRKPAKKFSPDTPEARDEGPRLIPLNPGLTDHTWGQYALELADVALGDKPSVKDPGKRPVRNND